VCFFGVIIAAVWFVIGPLMRCVIRNLDVLSAARR
jgi:hypothetical protein